jgi:hypothetical protein
LFLPFKESDVLVSSFKESDMLVSAKCQQRLQNKDTTHAHASGFPFYQVKYSTLAYAII